MHNDTVYLNSNIPVTYSYLTSLIFCRPYLEILTMSSLQSPALFSYPITSQLISQDIPSTTCDNQVWFSSFDPTSWLSLHFLMIIMILLTVLCLLHYVCPNGIVLAELIFLFQAFSPLHICFLVLSYPCERAHSHMKFMTQPQLLFMLFDADDFCSLSAPLVTIPNVLFIVCDCCHTLCWCSEKLLTGTRFPKEWWKSSDWKRFGEAI